MILYIGNVLSLQGSTPTYIETLSYLLSHRYSILKVSAKKNQIQRWIEMTISIIRYQRSINIVLVDTYSSLGFYFAMSTAFICRCLSIPYITILHGGNLRLRLVNSKWSSSFVFSNAELLIAPSNFMYSLFKEFGYNNILFIPNVIEIKNYKLKERISIAPRLLWVRSFHNVYNPLMAIKVLQKLSIHFPLAELCMVGPDKDGSLEKCKEYVNSNNLFSKVKFTGVLSKSDWLIYSQDYDIFINTTTVDNTPLSVIEAMALGLPVVSTNVGGLPFLVSDNETGLLVNSGDVDAMVSKIEFLISNPSFSFQLAQRARSHVESFDWEVVKGSWFTLLDKFEVPINY